MIKKGDKVSYIHTGKVQIEPGKPLIETLMVQGACEVIDVQGQKVLISYPFGRGDMMQEWVPLDQIKTYDK